jgi:signal recognition particle subunit SRP54
MFEALSDRLANALKRFSGRGRLTKEDVEVGLREVRVALLEADVNFRVARAFVDRIRERAVGSDVLDSLTPGQQIVKIVNEELVALLGGEQRKIQYQSHPPTVIMLVGLQGSGKTTTAAKLALAIRRDGHRPMLRGEGEGCPALRAWRRGGDPAQLRRGHPRHRRPSPDR